MKTKKISRIVTMFLLQIALCMMLCACGDGAETPKNETVGEGTEESSVDSDADGVSEDESKNLTDVTIVLDWTPNTNHTGLYVAKNKGYFAKAGLNVSIVQPPDSGATDMVASGGAQFGIDFQDSLAPAFGTDSPLPVTVLAAVLQHNTSGLVSLKEKGIDSPGKLEGHSYATWDLPIEQAMLKNVVEKDGGDFSKVNLISTYVEDIVAGLNSDIDSVWIYYGWDGIKLDMEGIETNYLSFADLDPVFDYYSPVIIGNNDFIKENPDLTKAFIDAAGEGYMDAVNNPEEAAEILLSEVPELDGELVKKSQQYLSKQYVAEMSSWGNINPERWNKFYNWLNENKLVEKEIPENAGLWEEYLK